MNTEQKTEFQFNPEGTLWKVSRERVILLGGSSALLKQLAYPPVAEALMHTGRLEDNPTRRLRTNAESGFNLIFGTEEENQRINEGINKQHRSSDLQLEITETTGAHQQGTKFSPRTQEGLGIVGATLIEGSVEGHRRFVGELTDDEKNDYVAEAKKLFSAMGLRKESLPDKYDGIREHIQTMIDQDRLVVGRIAHDLASLTMLANSSPLKLFTSYLQMVTYDMLPDKLREQYGYRITRGQRRFVHESAAAIRRAVPHMPDVIRFNPQYRRARKIMQERGVIAHEQMQETIIYPRPRVLEA